MDESQVDVEDSAQTVGSAPARRPERSILRNTSIYLVSLPCEERIPTKMCSSSLGTASAHETKSTGEPL
jgi:hypothetical protein